MQRNNKDNQLGSVMKNILLHTGMTLVLVSKTVVIALCIYKQKLKTDSRQIVRMYYSSCHLSFIIYMPPSLGNTM